MRLHEETLKNNPSPTLHDRRISQTPLNDAASMDCMPSPSPYADIHPQAKWADSELMPNRRSSSSSAASTSSSCSRRNDEDELKMRQDVMMVNHQALDMGYLQPGLPFPEPFSSFTETSQFVSPVSLFPPPSLNTSLAFPSTGPAMFPPAFGAPFPAPQVLPTLPKPVENVQYSSACTATFTSSQHNMALTAAMVNLPPSIPKEVESPPEEEVAPAAPPPVEETPPQSNTLSSPSPSIKSNSSGKKSPSKPTRTSARVTSQGKSPKQQQQQQEIAKASAGRGRGDAKRNSVKSNASRGGQIVRGRGRGRGRGRTHAHNDYEYLGANTIHNKLVGTVYDLDFDDDISNENVDLKSMRERRKSVDVQKTEAKDSSESPSQKSTRSYNDLRELRPPTPVEETPAKVAEVEPMFADMVQPVLPGPVDMRTYSGGGNFDQQNYNEANLLGAFVGTAETQVNEEIDEEFEKELQTALTAPSKKPEEPPAPEVGSNNIKVSLSDSRNQLKVKIKGPIANYSSTMPSLPPPTVDPVNVSNMNFVSNNVISNNSIGVSSGTSNLRRMRKKELLRQYWTQDMNMDDSSCAPINATPTVPPVNRTIITIPKAVASMTSIPTKDDYRDYRTGSDDIEPTKHHRKETKARPGALSRELRQLDLCLDEDGLLERRRSIGSVGSNNSGLSTSYDSSLNKRRGRPPRPSQQTGTPKIKIKIGNSIVGKVDDKRDRIRPPKKRLANINMPSVEDLKRESMKFRKLVMADFGESKEKRKKKDKSEKRKKKKSKSEVVQIISNESQKLIIRIGKKVESERTSGEGGGGEDGAPIKFKLSRCQEGSGYVMKRATPTQQPPSTETKAEEATQPGQPPPPTPPPPLDGARDGVPPPPPTFNKDCEDR